MKKILLFGLCVVAVVSLAATYENVFTTNPAGNPLAPGLPDLSNYGSPIYAGAVVTQGNAYSLVLSNTVTIDAQSKLQANRQLNTPTGYIAFTYTTNLWSEYANKPWMTWTGPGGGVTSTNGYSVDTVNYMKTPTNAPVAGQVVTASDAVGDTAWAAGGGSGGGGGTNSGPITLTVSANSIAVNASTPVGCATNATLPYRVTMNANAGLANPTGMLDGQRIKIEFLQDATGNRLLTLSNAWAFGSDITGLTLSTNANATDFITAVYNSTASKWRVIGFVRGY